VPQSLALLLIAAVQPVIPPMQKHSEAAPEWHGYCVEELSAEPMPFDCERIVHSGVRRLITMEK